MLEKNDGKLDNHLLWEQSKKEGAFEKARLKRILILKLAELQETIIHTSKQEENEYQNE